MCGTGHIPHQLVWTVVSQQDTFHTMVWTNNRLLFQTHWFGLTTVVSPNHTCGIGLTTVDHSTHWFGLLLTGNQHVELD